MYYFLCKAAAFEDGIVCKYFHVCSEAQNIKTFQYKKKEFGVYQEFIHKPKKRWE